MRWDFKYPFNSKFTKESSSEFLNCKFTKESSSEFFKSVKIWQNYGHESVAPLFWPTL